MVVKHQGFCFTHNNYTEEDVARIQSRDWIQFLAMGRELAPTTWTPHLQGFMWLTEPRTPQQVKRKLPGTVVLVPGKAKGVHYHVHDDGKTGFGYCFKEHQPGWVLQGTPPSEEEFQDQAPKGKGTRSDLLTVKKKIDSGVAAESLLGDDEHFSTFVHHRKYFEFYQSHKRRRLAFAAPTVTVIYGDTDCNKTRSVYDVETKLEELHVWEPHHGQWFDGYSGQEAVLFDEYRGQLPYGMLLCLLDGYPGRKVQSKGGMAYWSPKRIYITSPKHPREWYPQLAENDKIDQLLRRITEIRVAQPRSAN